MKFNLTVLPYAIRYQPGTLKFLLPQTKKFAKWSACCSQVTCQVSENELNIATTTFTLDLTASLDKPLKFPQYQNDVR